MLGDVLLIDDRHRRAGAQLLERLRERRAEKLIVTVAGESGTGKSEIAHVLAHGLKSEGRAAKLFHLDDYYRIPPAERAAWRAEHGIQAVGEGEIDWELLAAHLDAFRRGTSTTLPCIDLLTDQIDELTTSFAGIRVAIVEGLYALATPDADLRVLIDLTYHETRGAELARGKEAQTEQRRQVLEREHRVVQAMRDRADLWITRDYEVVSAPPRTGADSPGADTGR
jgi:uridine kinase